MLRNAVGEGVRFLNSVMKVYVILALKVILLDRLHTFNWWRPLRQVYAYSVNIGPRPANRPSAQTYTHTHSRMPELASKRLYWYGQLTSWTHSVTQLN